MTVNAAELVGLHNGTVLVLTYDWVTYLGIYFKKLPKIKLYYHFHFHKDYKGTVFCKESRYSEEKKVNLLCNGNAPALESYRHLFLLAELARNRLNVCKKILENFAPILTPLPSQQQPFNAFIASSRHRMYLLTYPMMHQERGQPPTPSMFFKRTTTYVHGTMINHLSS